MLLCMTSADHAWAQIRCAPNNSMVLGRTAGTQGVDLALEHDAWPRLLSRKHCRLQCSADGQLLVEDLHSINGTFVEEALEGAPADAVGNSNQEQQLVPRHVVKRLAPHVPYVLQPGCTLMLGGAHIILDSKAMLVPNPFVFMVAQPQAEQQQQKVQQQAVEPTARPAAGGAVHQVPQLQLQQQPQQQVQPVQAKHGQQPLHEHHQQQQQEQPAMQLPPNHTRHQQLPPNQQQPQQRVLQESLAHNMQDNHSQGDYAGNLHALVAAAAAGGGGAAAGQGAVAGALEPAAKRVCKRGLTAPHAPPKQGLHVPPPPAAADAADAADQERVVSQHAAAVAAAAAAAAGGGRDGADGMPQPEVIDLAGSGASVEDGDGLPLAADAVGDLPQQQRNAAAAAAAPPAFDDAPPSLAAPSAPAAAAAAEDDSGAPASTPAESRRRRRRPSSASISISAKKKKKKSRSSSKGDKDVRNVSAEHLYCTICRGLLVCTHILGCGHVSCGPCLAAWLEARQEASCFMCRAPVDRPPAPMLLMDQLVAEAALTAGSEPQEMAARIQQWEDIKDVTKQQWQERFGGGSKVLQHKEDRERSVPVAAVAVAGGGQQRQAGSRRVNVRDLHLLTGAGAAAAGVAAAPAPQQPPPAAAAAGGGGPVAGRRSRGRRQTNNTNSRGRRNAQRGAARGGGAARDGGGRQQAAAGRQTAIDAFAFAR